MASLLQPLQYIRQYKNSLDADAKFATIAELTAYLSNARRYAGQVVSCVETPEYIYVLNLTESDWISFPSKTYVDSLAGSLGSLKTKTTARFTTLLQTAGTYNNGLSGVGATLTISSMAWQAFDINVTMGVVIGDTFLIKNESDQTRNGIYTLTSGGFNRNSVFTRTIDFDQDVELYDGLFIFVQEGNYFGGGGFLQTAKVVTIGVSDIVFTQFSKSGVYSADEDTLTLTGLVFSVKETFRNLFWKKDDELYLQAGTVTQPTITTASNGSGGLTLQISDFVVRLHANANNTGAVKQYTVSGLIDVNLPQNTYYYLVASYVGGEAIASLITDNTLINHSNIINVKQLYYTNLDGVIELNEFSTGNYALGLSNKLGHRLIHTERFGYQDGLNVSVDGSLHLAVTAGTLWYDGHEIAIDNFDSNVTPFKQSSGTLLATNSVLNNMYYYNGTTVVLLSNGKYAVNWVYAMVTGGYYVVFGEGNYTLTEAQASNEPQLPEQVNKLGKLICRIIIEKNATTVTELKPMLSASMSGKTATEKENIIGLRITDSTEFADVNITSLSSNTFFGSVAKSVLASLNALFSSLGDLMLDSFNGSGNVKAELSKYKIVHSINGGNLTVSLAFTDANTLFYYKMFGRRRYVSPVTITSYTKTYNTVTEGLYYFYVDASTTDFSAPIIGLTKTAWNVKAGHVLLFTLYYNATSGTITRVGYEKHGHGRNVDWHYNEHQLGALHISGGTINHYNGLATLATNSDNNFGRALLRVDACTFQDEDNQINITHLDNAINATISNPSTDWAGNVQQFLGFNEAATTGTTSTSIVFTSTHTLVAGQAVLVMQGNTTTVRGTTTITTSGTGTTFTVASVTGMTSGDMIVVGARIPIAYLSDATNAIWRILTPTDFLGVSGGVQVDATTIATATMQYNNTSTGGFTDMTANRYFCVYLVETNLIHNPIIGILSQGQSSNGTLSTSLSENFAQFSSLSGLSGLNIQESSPIQRLTFLYNTTAGFNQNRMRLVDATKLNLRVNSTGNVSASGGGSSVVTAQQVYTSRGATVESELTYTIPMTEAHNQVLTFDKLEKVITHTQTDLINYSLAATGNVAGASIIILLEVGSIYPVYFDTNFVIISGTVTPDKRNYIIMTLLTNLTTVLVSISTGITMSFSIDDLQGITQYLQSDLVDTVDVSGTDYTWTDTVLSNVWTTVSGLNKPAYDTTNKKWVVSATNKLIATNNLTIQSTSFTLFFVFKTSIADACLCHHSSSTGGIYVMLRSAYVHFQVSNLGTFQIPCTFSTVFSNKKVALCLRGTVDGIQVTVNNVIIASINTGTHGTGVISRLFTNNDSSKNFTGDFYSLLQFTRTVTDAEMAKIFGSLNTKYSIY